MWKGDLHKAGVEANGFDLNVFRGNIYARNFPGSSGDLGMVFGESAQNWFVDGDVTASGTGKSWSEAFKTIAEAIAAAGDNDVIYLAPGMYTQTATLAITQDGLKLIGAGWHGIYVSWITGAGAFDLITVTGIDVTIANLEVYQTGAGNGISLGGSTHGCKVMNCNVDGTSTGLIGVEDLGEWNIVENCTIYNWVTSGIYFDGSYGVYAFNFIETIASGVGIDVDGGSNVRIAYNTIQGADDGDTGILLTTVPDSDEINMAGNFVMNCETPITPSAPTAIYDGNFLGVDDARYHSQAKTWFVDKDLATAGDGRSWMSAFKTVAAAIAVASNYDTVMIHEGVYDEGVVLEITQKGLRLLGENTTHYMYGTTSLKASAADHVIIDIQADQVEIAFLSFIQNNANKVITIDHTAAVYKTHIHDCHFGSAAATYGIDAGPGAFDAVDTIIERCHFTVGTALVGVRLNTTRSAVVDCYFAIAGSGTGMVQTPNTADRPYTRVIGCKFHAEDVVNGNGIVVTNTPTAGMFYVGDCLFSYFASDNKAVSKRTGYCGLNWRDAAVLPVT